MLKKLQFTLLAILFVTGTAMAAFVAPPAATNGIQVDPELAAMFAADGETITTEDFLALTPKQIRLKTGERLGFQKSIALKAAQKAIRKQMKKEAKMGIAEDAGGDKNQLVALLLAIFLGGLGIHSFYQGKTLKGILQIVLALTSWLIIPGILLFAWIIYDVITIAIGSQEPKNGTWDPAL